MADINIEVSPGTSKLLLTAGKMCNDDIIISAPAGKSSRPAAVVKADPNAFTFELDPGVSKRLLTAGKYCERNIMVTATGEKPAVTLDISQGSIVITDTGYTQGEESYNWTDGTPHALTITQSDPNTPVSNYIEVQSGTVEITLQGVNLNGSSSEAISGINGSAFCPFFIYGNANVTLILEGKNTLTSTVAAAGLEVYKGSTVTIKVPEGKDDGYGSLTATGSGSAAGIGSVEGRNAGTVNIRSGMITAIGGNGYVSGIGPGRRTSMTAINISGGHIINQGNQPLGNSNTCYGSTIIISGGYIETGSVGGSTYRGTIDLTISGGTIVTSKTPGIEVGGDTVLTITGGNIGDAYTGDIPGRTRTKLSFVTAGGSPIADTEIFVVEGDNEWSALTDEDGVVYTYLAADTTTIRAGVSYDRMIDVSIAGGEGTFVG